MKKLGFLVAAALISGSAFAQVTGQGEISLKIAAPGTIGDIPPIDFGTLVKNASSIAPQKVSVVVLQGDNNTGFYIDFNTNATDTTVELTNGGEGDRVNVDLAYSSGNAALTDSEGGKSATIKFDPSGSSSFDIEATIKPEELQKELVDGGEYKGTYNVVVAFN